MVAYWKVEPLHWQGNWELMCQHVTKLFVAADDVTHAMYENKNESAELVEGFMETLQNSVNSAEPEQVPCQT